MHKLKNSLFAQSLLTLLIVIIGVLAIGIMVNAVNASLRRQAEEILQNEFPISINSLEMIDELNEMYINLYSYGNGDTAARIRFYENAEEFDAFLTDFERILAENSNHVQHDEMSENRISWIRTTYQSLLSDTENNVFRAFDPEFEKTQAMQSMRLYNDIENFIIKPLKRNNLEITDTEKFIELLDAAYALREATERNRIPSSEAQEMYFRNLNALQIESTQICIRILLGECDHFTRKLNELENLGMKYFEGDFNITQAQLIDRINRYDSIYFDTLENRLEAIATISNARIKRDIGQLERLMTKVKNAILIATILVIIVIIFVYYYLIWRMILRPLGRISGILEHMGANNYAVDLPSARGSDEINVIYAALHKLKTSLIELDRLRDDQIRDVEKKSLQKLEKANKRLQKSEENLLRQKSTLESANAELEQFVHIASHDFREPLKNIAGFTQMLQQTPPDATDKRQNYLSHIQLNTARMETLIDDLRALIKLRSSEQNFEVVLLDEVVEIVFAEHSVELETRNVTIKTALLPHIIGIERYVRIVFDQLLTNAIQYGSEDLKIEITSEPADNQVVITFRNNLDQSIEPSQKLLLPFYRGSNAKQEQSGMGLAIVRKIVEDLHDGHVEIDEQNTNWFSVRLTFPSPSD